MTARARKKKVSKTAKREINIQAEKVLTGVNNNCKQNVDFFFRPVKMQEMSGNPLTDKIDVIRGKTRTGQLCARADITPQALRVLRRGRGRLALVMKLANGLQCTKRQRLELICEWLKLQTGSLARHFEIKIKA